MIDADGDVIVHGSCNRPEGPLDASTNYAQVYDRHGHVIGMRRPAGIRVQCDTRQVSSGMSCKAFEARYFETDVTDVTAKDGDVPDLFGNSDPQEGP